MQLIISTHPIGRTNIKVWKPNLFEILANKPNSSEVKEARRRVSFRQGYHYEPSTEYKDMIFNKKKFPRVIHNLKDLKLGEGIINKDFTKH